MNTAIPRQFDLLPVAPPADGTCHVIAVGRRRDGRMRYWCLAHKADATGKYGRKLDVCRGAGIGPISEEETLALNLARSVCGRRRALGRGSCGIRHHSPPTRSGHPCACSGDSGRSKGARHHLPSSESDRRQAPAKRPHDLRTRCRVLHGEQRVRLRDSVYRMFSVRVPALGQGLVRRSPSPSSLMRGMRAPFSR
jgi:hypothetical protein